MCSRHLPDALIFALNFDQTFVPALLADKMVNYRHSVNVAGTISSRYRSSEQHVQGLVTTYLRESPSGMKQGNDNDRTEVLQVFRLSKK
jgi:hypothetical protein